MAVRHGLVLSFSHTKKKSSYCLADRKQVINNKIGETMRGEVIVMLGCVKMAYLDVPSRAPSRNVEETSASEALPCTVVLTPC